MKTKLFKQFIRLNVLIFILLMIPTKFNAQQGFITTWNTNNISSGGSTSSQIKIPTVIGPGYNYNVSWLKVDTPTINGTLLNQTGSALIDNLTPGIYKIEITGTFPRILFNFGTERLKILTIEQWGNIAWSSMQNSFTGCSNLTYNAIDSPNLSGVTDMSYMFSSCSSLVGNSTMNNWNTSTITNMYALFNLCKLFNSNIGSWNTSNVTNMGQMFFNNDNFNQDISGWNTVNVMSMSFMFSGAKAFNQNLPNWNTASITDMQSMFYGAIVFNANIGTWNTLNVISMNNMFVNALAFNQNIGNWNTSNVTNMSNMFGNATVFNQNIGSWNTLKVTSMSGMFANALAFNQNIGNWNTANVNNMLSMFNGASMFNQNIGSWNTGNVTNLSNMFKNAIVFNQNIGNWNTIKVTNMSGMFNGATVFNQSLNSWNTVNVTNMGSMFYEARAFNGNISSWNTGKVTDTNGMFYNALFFNQDLSNWNTQLVTNMSFMFAQANVFNQNIGSWNISNVTNLTNMLNNAFAFNQNLGSWTFNSNVVLNNMLLASALDCSNFSASLIGWANNPLTPNNKNLGSVVNNGGSLRIIGNNALAARNTLVAVKGWAITGEDYSLSNCVLSTSSFENEKSLNVYPNPTKGIINIETKEALNVSVYDMLGSKVLDAEVNETRNQIDLTNLTVGVYLINTRNEYGRVKFSKIIIE